MTTFVENQATSEHAFGGKVDNSRLESMSRDLLNMSARIWFGAAVLGQWIFALYIAMFYGNTTLSSDWAAWNEVLAIGYQSGDTMGNGVLAVHLMMAFLITLGGPLQLLPQIRQRWPRFHRFNGRLYMLSAFALAFGGLYLIWGREALGNYFTHIGISSNAIAIIACAVLTLHFAMRGQIARHRRWALRLFLVVNGVWFFRVGLMLWLFIFEAPVGFDPKTLTGPFIYALYFAQTLLPLLVVEGYLRCQNSQSGIKQSLMAITIIILSIAMTIGIFAATMGMWLPNII